MVLVHKLCRDAMGSKELYAAISPIFVVNGMPDVKIWIKISPANLYGSVKLIHTSKIKQNKFTLLCVYCKLFVKKKLIISRLINFH